MTVRLTISLKLSRPIGCSKTVSKLVLWSTVLTLILRPIAQKYFSGLFCFGTTKGAP